LPDRTLPLLEQKQRWQTEQRRFQKKNAGVRASNAENETKSSLFEPTTPKMKQNSRLPAGDRGFCAHNYKSVLEIVDAYEVGRAAVPSPRRGEAWICLHVVSSSRRGALGTALPYLAIRMTPIWLIQT